MPLDTPDNAPDLRVLDIADIVPHPDNPRSNLGDTTELQHSIAQLGVLQPLIVVSRDAFLAANPAAANRLDNGTWVALDGHRRLEAATNANVIQAPVIVREDLAPIGDALRFMITVAVHHNDWSPMDEARAFARLRAEHGLSERDIAKQTGVSRGQVHKRLSLLRLPASIVADIDTGKLAITAALTLLELPDDQIEEAWTDSKRTTWKSLREVVDAQLKVNTGKNAVDALCKRLANLGIETVESAADVLGMDYLQHKLAVDDPDTIPNPADVIARVWRAGDEAKANYFTRTRPMITNSGEIDDEYDDDDDCDDDGRASDGSAPGESPEQQRDRRNALAEQATAAMTARAEACQRLVNADQWPDGLALQILADATMAGEESQTWDTTMTALSWCGSPFDPDESHNENEVDRWLQQQAADSATAARIAVALVLADMEDNISDPVRHGWSLDSWTQWQIRHVQRLIDHAGHDPNPYEQERLHGTGKAGQ
ncbi:MAG: ParB/RepB/Spo0J family partition protein [Kibdelosporangium sp.]